MNLTFNSNHYPNGVERPTTLSAEAIAVQDRPDGITIGANFARPGSQFYMNLNADDARAIAAVLMSAADAMDRLVAAASKIKLTVEVPAASAERFKNDVKSVFDGRVL